MGPNQNNEDIMRAMVQNGMDVARFNFSHGDHEEHEGRLAMLRRIAEEENRPVAALLDTKGPEIRTGLLEDHKPVMLMEGDTYTFHTTGMVGNEHEGYITYAGLPQDVEIGHRILVDDGLIELTVTAKTETSLTCRVLNGGSLGEQKGVNVPNVKIRLPGLTDKDKRDILFGIDHDFDFIAASFVRNADVIRSIRTLLRAYGSRMLIIAKIENAEGVENIDAILDEADGIMVARGDMGVELPLETLPHIQKILIEKARVKKKLVITATQMMDSMIRNPRPTRAEVTDVANAIYDGTDAVMLSGETAIGKHPIEALKTMGLVAVSTETYLNHKTYECGDLPDAFSKSISNAVSISSVITAHSLGARAIMAPTMSGFTARQISKLHPGQMIIAFSPNRDVIRKLMAYWGVYPILAPREADTTEMIEHSIEIAKKAGLVEVDDLLVFTLGIPSSKQYAMGSSIETNGMRVVTVE